MKVRCKAKVTYVEFTPKNGTYQPDNRHQIRMNAVWAGSSEQQAESENAIFGKWTPQFDLSMTILNDEAARLFVPECEYYVTFEIAQAVTPEQVAKLEESERRLQETIAEKRAAFDAAKAADDHDGVAAAAHDLRLYTKNLADVTYALRQMRGQLGLKPED